MPVSRRRRARNRPSSSRRPRWESHEEPIPDQTYRVLGQTAVAEAGGDPAEALRIHESFPPFADSPHSHVLRILTELGDDAPGWLWSRWMTIQAHRGDLDGNTSGPDPAVGRAIDAAYVHGVDLNRSPDLPPEAFGASLFQFHWIVRQLRVYEGGGLRHLVEDRASTRLVERADRIGDWLDAPMRGLQLADDAVDLVLPFTDLATGHRIELLDLGVACEHEPGTSFLGRVVPTSVAPGLMFEWRPLRVDDRTATEVAALDGRTEAWVDVLGRGHREQRLPGMYSWDDSMTPVSDLPVKAFIGLLLDHQIAGFPARPDGMIEMTEVAVRACTNALRVVKALDGQTRGIAPMVATALLWPGVFPLLQARLARPQLAGAWLAIARELPSPARARAEALAVLSERRLAA